VESYGDEAERTGRKWGVLLFCATCGVFVANLIWGPPISFFDKVPAERREHVLAIYHKNISILPLNVRSLEGFEGLIDSLRPKIQRTAEGPTGYAEKLEPWEGKGFL